MQLLTSSGLQVKSPYLAYEPALFIKSKLNTGFDYKFNALSCDPEKHELLKPFSTIFKEGEKPSVIPVLQALCPPLRRFLVRIPL